LGPQEHRIVFGAPGSGKTQIMLHRAAYLREYENLKADRLHIFVFTKVLKRYIQSGLEIVDIPLDCVSTLDSWCAQYQRDVIGRTAYGKNAEDRFRNTRRAVLEHLRNNRGSDYLYDYVLVDEGQDLDPSSFELLTRIARHVTVYMDPKQQIYDQRSTEQDVLRGLGLRKRNMTLLDAFRCCPHIVHAASAFVQDQEERQQYILQARTAQVEKETPLLYRADSFDDERSRLIDIIRTRQLKGDRIGILFPLTRQVAGFAQGLREAGLQVETQDVSKNRAEHNVGLDFGTSRPKLLTYHSAKGLTFDTVFMPRLTAKTFPDISQERIERLLFVGITRATKWLYMSTTCGKDLPCLSKLEPLEP
jgi:superfamily I DNA/RNA helicase